MPASWDIAIVVAFVVGLLLYGIGTSMLRSTREVAPVIAANPRAAVTWPRLVDEALVDTDPQLRLDIVERLTIVGEPWCLEILREANETETDPQVKQAISAALHA